MRALLIVALAALAQPAETPPATIPPMVHHQDPYPTVAVPAPPDVDQLPVTE